MAITSMPWCDGICVKWRAWLGMPCRRVKGKKVLGNIWKACLHKSMSSIFGKVLPIWNRVVMLRTSLITGSPFKIAYSWAIAIPCHSKVLEVNFRHCCLQWGDGGFGACILGVSCTNGELDCMYVILNLQRKAILERKWWGMTMKAKLVGFDFSVKSLI